MTRTKKERNYSIDLFRIVFALGVVAIHAHPFKDVNYTAYFVFVDIFSRLSVPFFFTVSGYFFIKRMESGQSPKPYFYNLLRIYGVWSAIYGVIFIFIKIFSGAKIKDVIFGLFKGVFFGVSEHLWFFPALFLALFAVWLFYKIKQKYLIVIFGLLLYFVCVISTAYSNFLLQFDNLAFLSEIKYEYIRVTCVALPYLSVGYILNLTDKQKNNKILNLCVLFLVGALYVIEKFAIKDLSLGRSYVNSFVLPAVIFLVVRLLINNNILSAKKYASGCRDVANFTYYAHPMFLEVLRVMIPVILTIGRCETLVYVLTCVITVCVGYLLHKKNNPKLNKLFK